MRLAATTEAHSRVVLLRAVRDLRRWIGVVLASITAVATSSAWAQDPPCRWQITGPAIERSVASTMHNGQSCTFNFVDLLDGTIQVTDPPQHGAASISGRILTYRAEPGFTGRVTFDTRGREDVPAGVLYIYWRFTVQIDN
jgi:hypothetical protein